MHQAFVYLVEDAALEKETLTAPLFPTAGGLNDWNIACVQNQYLDIHICFI